MMHIATEGHEITEAESLYELAQQATTNREMGELEGGMLRYYAGHEDATCNLLLVVRALEGRLNSSDDGRLPAECRPMALDLVLEFHEVQSMAKEGYVRPFTEVVGDELRLTVAFGDGEEQRLQKRLTAIREGSAEGWAQLQEMVHQMAIRAQHAARRITTLGHEAVMRA
jgi:hypothetical protein